MANSFTLPATLVSNLQKIYAHSLFTIDLVGPNEDVSAGNSAKEIAIPKMQLDDLVDYDRVNGFNKGNITVTTQTVQVNYDRGRSFGIDAVDEQEVGIKAGRILSRFEEQKVAKDKDIFTFSTLANAGKTPVNASLSTFDDWAGALRTAYNSSFNAGANPSNEILYITAEGKGILEDADTTKSRAVLGLFGKVVVVPQSLMFTNAQKHGGAGSYEKSSTSKDIHFMLVDPTAVIDYDKYLLGKVVDKDVNTDADEYVIKYRKVSYVDVYDELKDGVYTHTEA